MRLVLQRVGVLIAAGRSDSKHGHRETRTEVPRETLLSELRRASTLRSTQELEPGGKLVLTQVFEL